MAARELPAVRETVPLEAFTLKLRYLLAPPRGMSVADLASRSGLNRIRLHQVLAGTTPPPGPEAVDRLAQALGLSPEERHLFHWLAIRDRADPQARALIEIYEDLLSRAWNTKNPDEFTARLGDRLELCNFAIANKALFLRHADAPLSVLVHDEDGRMAKSLVDGWIVRVEPEGMYDQKFLTKALKTIVLVNVGRQCRIGWLRKGKGGSYRLFDDFDTPLLMSHAQSRGGRVPEDLEVTIHPTSDKRPYIADIQALIPKGTLEEIKRLRSEKQSSEEAQRQQTLQDSIYALGNRS